jgi:hypothetical protein
MSPTDPQVARAGTQSLLPLSRNMTKAIRRITLGICLGLTIGEVEGQL